MSSRVLVVEESPTQAAQLPFVLEDEGFQLEERAGRCRGARRRGGGSSAGSAAEARSQEPRRSSPVTPIS